MGKENTQFLLLVRFPCGLPSFLRALVFFVAAVVEMPYGYLLISYSPEALHNSDPLLNYQIFARGSTLSDSLHSLLL
ncbi:hypothetical protein scyTo_0010007 [Scyliorhinus torazame]|uniref:Uncharacterized protein n=1 Tax=Scyliorhinus torazame TaxID=75743 RepID=A0A401NY27_SCYTO|nr:hypothetical protein [Scyliorhinus torazame]